MKVRRTSKQTEFAFSLVELLTVIGILALLSSLLLTAVNSSKRKALGVTCINNLKQIGLGFRMYLDDNNGHYPLRISMKGSTGVLPPAGAEFFDMRFFDWAIGGTDPLLELPTLPRASERPLFNYLKEPLTFECPLDNGWKADSIRDRIKPSLFKAFGSSYWYNASPAGPGERLGAEGIAGKPEAWVKNPDKFILMYECAANGIFGSGFAGSTSFVRAAWHERQMFVSPILFLDGHVAVHDFRKPETAATPIWKNASED